MIVSRRKKAFTFFEMMIVVIIIGLLFVLLVSRVDWTGGKAKATAAETELMSYQTVLQDICATGKGLPGSVSLLSTKINEMCFTGVQTTTGTDDKGRDIAESVAEDPWGNKYRIYLATQGEKGTAALVVCAGLDGQYLTSDDMSCSVLYDTTGVYPRVRTEQNSDGEVHLSGGWEIVKAPSCDTPGERRQICCLCNKLMATEELPAAHIPVVIAAVAPTCTTTGLSAGEQCSVCQKILTAQTELPALGHSYVETTFMGMTVNKCTVCGAEEVVVP